MSETSLLTILKRHAQRAPAHVALQAPGREVSWERLPGLLVERRDALRARGLRSLALLADNGVGWVLTDLAAACAGLMLVPLPSFFSDEQVAHALATARPDAIVTDDETRLRRATGLAAASEPWHDGLRLVPLADGVVPPVGVTKVTFTSGSTGHPKGVTLTSAGQLAVAEALRTASGIGPGDRHLCSLPLAVLLENVAGIWRTLLAGGCVLLPHLRALGVSGSSSIDGARLARALVAHDATSAIFTPEVLASLLDAIEHGAPFPRALRFTGVGGASVPLALLLAAEARGLPVFEGYGLSEATSVVALNAPGARRHGSVGRPLAHVRVRVDEHGEIHVAGPGVTPGYLGQDATPGDGWLPTGDLGFLDEDGFLYLDGRSKNVFVTSYGRNVSPEWIERLLLDVHAVHQAAVFGEGRPGPVAVLVTDADEAEIERALARLDAHLPDYARITGWVRAHEPFSTANGQWLATGRPRRDAISTAYEQALSTCARAPAHPTITLG